MMASNSTLCVDGTQSAPQISFCWLPSLRRIISQSAGIAPPPASMPRSISTANLMNVFSTCNISSICWRVAFCRSRWITSPHLSLRQPRFNGQPIFAAHASVVPVPRFFRRHGFIRRHKHRFTVIIKRDESQICGTGMPAFAGA